MAGLRRVYDPEAAQITPEYRIAPEAVARDWNPEQEAAFQNYVRMTPWHAEFEDQYGEPPELNTPDYNYRAAWQAGVQPEIYEFDKKYHWPSVTEGGESLKATNHPTAWMEDYMQITGGRDPHDGYQVTPQEADALGRALQYRYNDDLAARVRAAVDAAFDDRKGLR